jgi:hypothetical protein
MNAKAQRVVDPMVLHMLFVRAFGEADVDCVIAGPEIGHLERELGDEAAAGGNAQGPVAVDQISVVAEQLLPHAILDVEADDRPLQIHGCLALDAQGDILAARGFVQDAAGGIEQADRAHRSAAQPEPRRVRIEIEDFDRLAPCERGGAHIRARRLRAGASTGRRGRGRDARTTLLEGAAAGLEPARGIALLVECGEVVVHDLLRHAALADAAAVEPDRLRAQIHYHVGVVRDEQQRAALHEAADEAHALLHEGGIADGQHFVDYQDIGIDMRAYGEGEPRIHAAGIVLDRLIHELADSGELRDGVEAGADLGRAQSQHGRGDEHVLAPGQFRVEAGAELEHGGDPAVHLERAGARADDAARDLQQRRLAGSVAAHDAEAFAAPRLEIDVAERPEIAVMLAPAAGEGLAQPVDRTRVDLVSLAQPRGADGDLRRHPRTARDCA